MAISSELPHGFEYVMKRSLVEKAHPHNEESISSDSLKHGIDYLRKADTGERYELHFDENGKPIAVKAERQGSSDRQRMWSAISDVRHDARFGKFAMATTAALATLAVLIAAMRPKPTSTAVIVPVPVHSHSSN